jgi:cellulose synthase/poly-beta-1,6-N-acetylglucosamine synthase-like glycosyltransferase
MHQLMVVFIFIAILLSVLYYAVIIYYRFAYKSIPKYDTMGSTMGSTMGLSPLHNGSSPLHKGSSPLHKIKLTIIIPARNEAANIENCLNSIIQNNYPINLFEIIVVDDHSEDETAGIVKKYASKNIKLISLKDFVTDKINSYKKKAIEVAIAQASGTLIITTDADCIVPPTWLQTIAQFYEEKKPAFIAAPVLIETTYPAQTQNNNENAEGIDLSRLSPRSAEGKGVRLFQSLDFMTLQGITAAVVHKKQMTMCNGANMAYERKAFDEVGGFAGIDNIASGDDMLLMHKIYKQYPDRVLFLNAKDAIVKTAAVNTISQFFNQRIRWASKADKYDDKRILPVLVVVYFFNVVMLALPIIVNFQFSIFNFGSVVMVTTFKDSNRIVFLISCSKFF